MTVSLPLSFAASPLLAELQEESALAPSSPTLNAERVVGDAPDVRGIEVVFEGFWAPSFQSEVYQELVSQLERDGFTVAGEDASVPSVRMKLRATDVMHVFVALSPPESPATDLDRVRAIDLQSTPSDARSLEIAIAATELLMASWNALTVPVQVSGSPPETEVPSAPTPPATSPAPLRRHELRRHELRRHELQISADAYATVHLTSSVGGALGYTFWAHPRVGISLGLSGTSWLPRSTPRGDVRGASVLGSAGVTCAALVHHRWRLDIPLVARPGVTWLWARADAGFTGVRVTVPVLDISAGVRPSVRVGGVWLGILAELGGIVQGIQLRDNGQTVGRYRGLLIHSGFFVTIPLAARREEPQIGPPGVGAS